MGYFPMSDPFKLLILLFIYLLTENPFTTSHDRWTTWMKALALDLKPLNELVNICLKLTLIPQINTLFTNYNVLPGFCMTTLFIYFIHCRDKHISKTTDCCKFRMSDDGKWQLEERQGCRLSWSKVGTQSVQ